MAGKKSLIPAGCEIMNCSCKHDFQDLRYGKGKRVCNAKKCKSGGLEYKCTVCGAIHGAPARITLETPSEKEKDNAGKAKGK